MNYWGKPDGSIDFCEENYKENMYVAEYWNTITASMYFVIGLIWTFSKYKRVAVSFMFLSIGTALWHGTLRYWGQWTDEVGMLILTFNFIKTIHPSLNYNWLVLLILIYFSFHDIFLIFGGLFVVLQIYLGLCTNYMSKRLRSNDINIYLFIALVSGFIWMLDTFYCDMNGINYHSLWHITTGVLGHWGLRIKNKYDKLNLMN